MTSREIRQQFLDFFASKGHKIIPSAPMVAKSDPTLMFINSGMAPLKDFFLGNQTPPAKRVADTQKCLRVSGKHNDLEDVGFDGYHHTMFEMLGNWSFGDYFKKDALTWSWELLTDVYKIPKDRLYVSVFKGDAAQNLPFDQEAFDTWRQFVPEDRILPFGKKENFWEMGDQGPCGPCSEIHVDLRTDADRAKVDGRILVNADDPNVIEVWNNVFMQFNRKADGSLEELPAKSVDTGMGFERLCRAVQGVASNYDTDLWRPLFSFLEQASGKTYTGSYAREAKTDVAMRVVADHLRAVSFAIADGELPSSGGAGYVIRRILRRAVRYYYSFLDLKEPVLYRMCPILAEEFRDVFPELKEQIDFVVKVILEEEKSFLRTLELGLKRIDNLDIQNNTVSGEQAFELLDTFGFPYDLTSLLAREKGWDVDEEGFKAALQIQKDRSRKDAAKQVGDWMVLSDENNVEFVGYDQLETRNSQVIKYRSVATKGETQYQIVLNRTPFYPEGGGQVGDTGWMTFGTERIRVVDTKKENTLVIHMVEKLPEEIDDQTVRCQVDETKRRLTESNHSATHLLHAALRKVLGTHVQQKGSFLDDHTLRFDFQHFQKMTDAEIAEIEQIVNEKIRENIALEESRNLPIEEARKAGAMMLFGEKYGDSVRMITFDPAYSRELCGGCHVQRTGEIGYFKVTSESAVAAGVRRIEAVTAVGAEQYVSVLEKEMQGIKSVIKGQDLYKGILALQEEKKQLEKKRDELYLSKASQLMDDLKSLVDDETYDGFNLLVQKINLDDLNVIKTLSQNLEASIKDVVIILANEKDDKLFVTVRVSENLVKQQGISAGKIVDKICKEFLDGKGGGAPTFATGSGVNKQGWESVMISIRELIPNQVAKNQIINTKVTVPTNEFSTNLFLKFAKEPFLQHNNTSSWKQVTSKSTDYQRKTVLNQGRVDFTQPFYDHENELNLRQSELVDLYCYYYMQMHYASTYALLKVGRTLINEHFLNHKDLLFLDMGCGPMTSGAAFIDFYKTLDRVEPLNMFYAGFDNAEEMIDRAERISSYAKEYAPESRFEFATDELRLFELIDTFNAKFKKHDQSAIIINLCYTLAADWFGADENLDRFAALIMRITAQFEGQTICLLYQNPDHKLLHRNWEKLKSKLPDFGNIIQRSGTIEFTFDDVAGSCKYPKPSRTVYIEWFANENI